MIKELYLYRSESVDPYYNLATERTLFDLCPEDSLILYLWQNEMTVVTGRNQNALRECRVSLLTEEGGRLARRLSGGGAVFHDLGNLNFTFILPRRDLDIPRQSGVIVSACRALGVSVGLSGRNDILLDGKKISGSAYYKSGERAYHHGTLLIKVDPELIGRYLSPPSEKLRAKGVSSVRSRVTDLCSAKPELTVKEAEKALIEAAVREYGLEAKEFVFPPAAEEERQNLCTLYSSKEWLFGSDAPASFSFELTFLWGSICIELSAERGIITGAKVYTDAMDPELAKTVERSLLGREFSKRDMIAGVSACDTEESVRSDLIRALEELTEL